MVGYPIYNNVDNSDDVYLSDIIVENGKYFSIGFIFSIATTPSVAFAFEAVAGQEKLLEYLPIPAPSSAPVPPQGNVPTTARNTVHGLVSIAGC